MINSGNSSRIIKFVLIFKGVIFIIVGVKIADQDKIIFVFQLINFLFQRFGVCNPVTFGTSLRFPVIVKKDKMCTLNIKSYFENYSGVSEYINQATMRAQEEGYVDTLLGRRRYISGLTARNRHVRDGAIREAINMPLQGSAADIMKLAMVDLENLINEKYDGKVFWVLQIHDEFVFEVAEDIVKEFSKEAEKVMEDVIEFSVPLEAHVSVGDDVSELK